VVLSGIAPSLGNKVNGYFTFRELKEMGPYYSQINDFTKNPYSTDPDEEYLSKPYL
jgi:hypothetical protein